MRGGCSRQGARARSAGGGVESRGSFHRLGVALAFSLWPVFLGSDEERGAMPKQIEQPGPGRSTAAAAFDDLRKEIAQRNEHAHQKARKARAARDRKQVLARRQQDLL